MSATHDTEELAMQGRDWVLEEVKALQEANGGKCPTVAQLTKAMPLTKEEAKEVLQEYKCAAAEDVPPKKRAKKFPDPPVQEVPEAPVERPVLSPRPPLASAATQIYDHDETQVVPEPSVPLTQPEQLTPKSLELMTPTQPAACSGETWFT